MAPQSRKPLPPTSQASRDETGPATDARDSEMLTLSGNKANSVLGRQDAISTETLFGDRREVLITHEGALYRLRITSKDKLILTK